MSKKLYRINYVVKYPENYDLVSVFFIRETKNEIHTKLYEDYSDHDPDIYNKKTGKMKGMAKHVVYKLISEKEYKKLYNKKIKKVIKQIKNRQKYLKERIDSWQEDIDHLAKKHKDYDWMLLSCIDNRSKNNIY